MKKYLYILGVVSLLPLLFTSCNQDNEGAIYNSTSGNYVSFAQKTINYSFGANESEISVPLYRENTSGAETITLKPINSKVLSLESSTISFADGQNTAYAKVKANLDVMDYGPTYIAGLKIADAGRISTFGVDSITVSLGRTLTWSTMKQQGTFESEAFGDIWNVTVQKADQTTFYIINDCYEKGYNIRFDIDKLGNVKVATQKAWTDSKYGVVSVSGTGTYANGVATVALNHSVSAGSFGVFTEKFTIPAN